jgi:hypothetical protein
MSIREIVSGLGLACVGSVVGAIAPSAGAAISVVQTVSAAEVGVGSVLSPGPINPFHVQQHVFVGSRSLPFGGGPVSGAPIVPVAVNLGSDTAFRFTVAAPEGFRYRVNLPAGAEGSFLFNVHLGTNTAPGVTLTPPASVGFEIDGVAQAVQPQGQGVDPGGQAILIDGNETSPRTAPFTFQQLTVTLSYPVDSGGVPLTVTGGTQLLGGLSDAHVTFQSANLASAGAPQPFITVEAVPEPGTVALIGVAGVAVLACRRRVA